MSKIRFYKNGRDVTDDNKNQNIVPTEMLFEMFNKIPNRKEGNSEMGMDEYEQKNLAAILDRLNKAEAENLQLKAEIETLKKREGVINWLQHQKDDVSELTIKFRKPMVF